MTTSGAILAACWISWVRFASVEMPKPLLTPYSLHLEGGQCQVGKENDDKVELGVTRFTLYLEKWARNRTMCDGQTNANEIIT